MSETKFRKWRSHADRDAVAVGVPSAVPPLGMAEIIILRVVKEGMVNAAFAAELSIGSKIMS